MTPPPTLIDFICRRSRPFIEPHKSLEHCVGGAYIQGMNDALDAIGYFEQPIATRKEKL